MYLSGWSMNGFLDWPIYSRDALEWHVGVGGPRGLAKDQIIL